MVSAAAHPVDPAIHKIQHVGVIQQENRSFDSYFGTYPGAGGLPSSTCVSAPDGGPCVAPRARPRDAGTAAGGGQPRRSSSPAHWLPASEVSDGRQGSGPRRARWGSRRHPRTGRPARTPATTRFSGVAAGTASGPAHSERPAPGSLQRTAASRCGIPARRAAVRQLAPRARAAATAASNAASAALAVDHGQVRGSRNIAVSPDRDTDLLPGRAVAAGGVHGLSLPAGQQLDELGAVAQGIEGARGRRLRQALGDPLAGVVQESADASSRTCGPALGGSRLRLVPLTIDEPAADWRRCPLSRSGHAHTLKYYLLSCVHAMAPDLGPVAGLIPRDGRS